MHHLDQSLITGRKINIESSEEVKYWCELFGCTKNDLLDTIFKVGSSAVSVDAYLAMNCLSKARDGKGRQQSQGGQAE